MSHTRRCATPRRAARLAALLLGALTASRQLDAQPSPKPVVMVLGSYHMANPGLDRNNLTVDDHLAPRRQAELEALAAQLAAFRPTKIMLEYPLEKDSALNVLYAHYRDGTGKPTASELAQVGFRLAHRLGHARVYATDHRRDLALGKVFGYAMQNGQAEYVQGGEARIRGMIAEGARRLPTMTVSQFLAEANSPRADSLHSLYLQLARVGSDSSYVGADVVSDWYIRNLRIYANIARRAHPGDRILVVYGSGHRPLLNEFLRQSELFQVEEVRNYLTARAAAR